MGDDVAVVASLQLPASSSSAFSHFSPSLLSFSASQIGQGAVEAAERKGGVWVSQASPSAP